MGEKRIKRERTENDEKIITMFKHMLVDLKLSQKEIEEMMGDSRGAFNARISRGESNTIQSLLAVSRVIGGSVTVIISDKDNNKWECELK